MQKDIHPQYKELKIKVGDDVFTTMSTLKEGEILMDVDFRQHPAWNKSKLNVVNQANKNISDFNKKFGNMFSSMKK